MSPTFPCNLACHGLCLPRMYFGPRRVFFWLFLHFLALLAKWPAVGFAYGIFWGHQGHNQTWMKNPNHIARHHAQPTCTKFVYKPIKSTMCVVHISPPTLINTAVNPDGHTQLSQEAGNGVSTAECLAHGRLWQQSLGDRISPSGFGGITRQFLVFIYWQRSPFYSNPWS